MKTEAQQKSHKIGIFVSKGLLRSNILLLKVQHHQRMKHNMTKQLLKWMRWMYGVLLRDRVPSAEQRERMGIESVSDTVNGIL